MTVTVVPGRLTEDGIWVSAGARRGGKPVAGLLLDRDGVLVREVNYLHRRRDVEIATGAVELLRWAAQAGLPAAVVTNQAGIARGMFGWDAFLAVQDEITSRLAAEGVGVALTVACPFHPEHTPGWGAAHRHWRKPGPGMLQQAGALLNLDLGHSWMVGDNESDTAAARAAGLAGAVHVLTGHGARYRDDALRLDDGNFRVRTADNLSGALDILRSYFPEQECVTRVRARGTTKK
jgi:D-glycero-D-manno-heptose 1,7-bisphosphate phosphatase